VGDCEDRQGDQRRAGIAPRVFHRRVAWRRTPMRARDQGLVVGESANGIGPPLAERSSWTQDEAPGGTVRSSGGGRRSRRGASASIPARIANSIPANIATMWGISTAVGGSPRKRVMAGSSGNTARCPPSQRRTWYSSLPATGCLGSIARRSAPSRFSSSTCQGSEEG
jgi:hypothetical protein